MTERQRGRPKNNKTIIDVNGLLLEYIVTNIDKYDNEVSYFKVVDKKTINVEWHLKEVCEECNMPFWNTEDHEYMLKVKKRNHPKTVLENNDIATANLTFKYYCMDKGDGSLMQRYFTKITSYEEDNEN